LPFKPKAIHGAVAAFVGVAAVGVLALIPGALPSLSDDSTRLTAALQHTIDTEGVDAAVTRYRTLRAQGFAGLHESESDTNTLGYALLRKDPRAAIKVLQLNVETHPQSANVYDSLGEAYLAAGDRARAIDNYEKAIALNPRQKSTRYALQALTGRHREPYRPLVLFHILAGLIGITSGAVAICLRKGSRRHSVVGTVFAVSMMSMAGSATYMALVRPDGDAVNVMMGLLTFYLVATAWISARRRRAQTNRGDWVALAVAVAIAVSLATFGVEAAGSPSGTKDGSPAGVYFTFAVVALLAAGLDLRMIVRGGVTGAARLTRHLWRMCAALFIAVGSFFLGQSQVFPVAIRNSGALAVPTLLVIVALGYWLVRVNGSKKSTKTVIGVPKAFAISETA
jgi:hypothetical protein